MTTQTAPATARRMTARFPGTCCECHARFAAGTEILYAKGYTAHAHCPTAEEIAAAPVVAEPVRALVAVAPLLAALAAARDAVSLPALWAASKAAHEAAEAALRAAGLCPTCRGTGGYEIRWSDGSDWAHCSCPAETRRDERTIRAAHPEVEALCAAADAALAAAREGEETVRSLTRREETLTTVAKFAVVEVVKGRKVPVGTVGTVIWMGAGRSYGPTPRYGYRNWYQPRVPARLGIKDAEGTVHWTAASNVEVVEVDAAVAAAAGF